MSDAEIDLPLADFISAVKRELRIALKETASQTPRLKVNRLDLELQVAGTKDASVEGGVKLWVLSLGGKAASSNGRTHTIKLSLDALDDEGGNLKIRNSSSRRPS